MTIIPFKNISPMLDPTSWLAPNCTVIGDTSIGARSTIWFGAVLRGDVMPIRIGNYTNVQDNAVIHTTTGGKGTRLGNNVTIGHSAIIHDCTVEDCSLVGMGAIVLDGAVVQTGSMVAAGALVAPNKIVESGWLWAGVPARPVRLLTDKEKAYLGWSSAHYAQLGEHYR